MIAQPATPVSSRIRLGQRQVQGRRRATAAVERYALNILTVRNAARAAEQARAALAEAQDQLRGACLAAMASDVPVAEERQRRRAGVILR